MKKKILLLGGFGFISTNLLKYIDEYFLEKYHVVTFDRTDCHPHGIEFLCVENSYAGDFSDETQIEKIFQKNKVDMVLHFLSTTIPATSNNALYDIESNLVPTIKLLGIMGKYGVKDILYISSGGAVYGDYLEKVHNEDDAVYPKSSYGVVKVAIEKFLMSYSELYGFNCLVLRLSNLFGPYHYSDYQGAINIAIRKALANKTFQVWGDGNGVKDYIYVRDVCDVLMQLIEGGIHTEVYNVASGSVLSINTIVEYIRNEIPDFRVEYTEASISDVQSFELDVTKLRKKLGRLRMTPFDEAFRYTMNWHKENQCKTRVNQDGS